MSITRIKKRDGRTAKFDLSKIEAALLKAFMEEDASIDNLIPIELAEQIKSLLDDEGKKTTSVEHVQDLIEKILIENNYATVAKSYILFRAERDRVRQMKTRLMKTYEEITWSSAADSEIKRENANVDGDSPMGAMLKFGSEGSKQFYKMFLLKPEHAQAHDDGDIHIHDLDFYSLTTTCCQIELSKLLENGFSTGHGNLREPSNIQSAAALACIAIQANQNDQHGGQSIVDFDYALAKYVRKSYEKNYKFFEELGYEFHKDGIHKELLENKAWDKTSKDTYQAMESLIHNLNTMNSRAGSQTPFSSINYGMDTSKEGRLVIEQLLLATEAGLGNGETPIFPIQIFRVKEGINFNTEDKSYDLFKLACRCSAKRLFPNFAFVDAPFNLQYYKGTPETEIAYMGCRTRVISNDANPDNEICAGRGNLSFTSINLPRLAIKSKKNIKKFYQLLDDKFDLVIDQLLERFEIQCRKHKYNYPFLMGQGVWINSEKLADYDEVREVLRHGTMSVGFIGLAETLISLTGKHHAESEESQQLGLEIISYLRARCDNETKKRNLNFSLLATPAEGLSDRFTKLDVKQFGILEKITDKGFYTNGFHCPVTERVSAFHKLAVEAPYHALTNAGHISYIEMDGNPLNNLEAFESIIRYMKDVGIGYGSINHPVDTDPVCGYTGVIDDVCPNCGRKETEDAKFIRIRRITGYLVGGLERFNNGKLAEVKARVKHT